MMEWLVLCFVKASADVFCSFDKVHLVMTVLWMEEFLVRFQETIHKAANCCARFYQIRFGRNFDC